MMSEAKTVSEVGNKKQLPALLIGAIAGLTVGAVLFGLGYYFGDLELGLVLGCIVGPFLGLMAAGMVASERFEERRRAAWEAVSQGVFDRVEYVPRGRYHRLATVIYFDDGRASVLTDKSHDIGFPRGTKIEVKKNGLDDYRIEVLK